jgi:phage terminase small subunit
MNCKLTEELDNRQGKLEGLGVGLFYVFCVNWSLFLLAVIAVRHKVIHTKREIRLCV